MQKSYIPISITKTPAVDDGAATFAFAYVRELTVEGEIIRSNPHRGTFPDTQEGRAAEYQINPDGKTRTGQQILDEFGVS